MVGKLLQYLAVTYKGNNQKLLREKYIILTDRQIIMIISQTLLEFSGLVWCYDYAEEQFIYIQKDASCIYWLQFQIFDIHKILQNKVRLISWPYIFFYFFFCLLYLILL